MFVSQPVVEINCNLNFVGTLCCAQHLRSLMNWKTRRNLREISATKKHIQCTFIERELLGFLWFEIILYKQRLIELFGSYVWMGYWTPDSDCPPYMNTWQEGTDQRLIYTSINVILYHKKHETKREGNGKRLLTAETDKEMEPKVSDLREVKKADEVKKPVQRVRAQWCVYPSAYSVGQKVYLCES
ncbi:hypothetical protein PROFUN_15954 [Planoprotostelium fungivorum]|uniref:Uncharacterized protein n=1 Tax=Planoprotostelium fungivorum TaxID=1890364 RepID=A0A2P6MTY4_9EUKA|nr:hypothetical protein PROFUN_15954 [Planoprotostelium fungivorum]